jgi:hypothetical protein
LTGEIGNDFPDRNTTLPRNFLGCQKNMVIKINCRAHHLLRSGKLINKSLTK